MQLAESCTLFVAVCFCLLSKTAHGNLLIPGIMTETIALAPKTSEYLGFLQSAVNDTEVEIRVRCHDEVPLEFDLQFVIRTSPCAKEFIVDKQRFSQVSNLLAFYFEESHRIPYNYHYNEILYYKSDVQHFSCADHYGVDLFMSAGLQPVIMSRHNVTPVEFGGYQSLHVDALAGENNSTTKIGRRKRDIYPGLNRDTIDGGAKRSLTSWHPVQRLPIDAIYLLVLKIIVTRFPDGDSAQHKLDAEVQWRGPNGYLSAIDAPLLTFYGAMCLFYASLAMAWLVACLRHWRDLLRIQFCIAGVIIVGMVEKAIFYAEYSNMNTTGESIEGLLELAELISCLKRTIAHVLVIVVSVGFGVVKPRLGATMNQVLAVGICYFLFCSLEGLARVSKQSTEVMKEKQIAKVPLAFLEMLIAWWIFSSLINTMRALRLRRNNVKLALYRNFTNVLALATVVALLYMFWSLYMHIVQYCMSNWKQLWIDTAFWHVFFCTILVAIVILWRPSRNNQRYAFTPLLDDSEDENDVDEDELFSNAPAHTGAYEIVRRVGVSAAPVQGGISLEPPSAKCVDNLQADLHWIEHNIPTAIAESLVDEDVERELRQLEMSKML